LNFNELKKMADRKKEMLRWYKCKQEGDVPSARDSHSAVVVNNQVYMFAGQDLNETLLNDLYRINI
jgi:hypothetical protein